MLTLIASLGQAIVEIKIQFLEPGDLSDNTKITDLDSIPGYTVGTDKVMAVGVWEDVSASAWSIFVLNIKDEGVSYDIKYSFSLDSPAFTSAPIPELMYAGSKYLLSF